MLLRAIAALVLASGASGPAPTASISVLAYNVAFDSTATDKTLDAIGHADADILCLTEVTRAFAARGARRFGTTYPHTFVRARPSGTRGLAIASRFPLLHPVSFPQRPHRMPAAEARVETPSGPVLVSCVHLFPPGAKRHSGESLLSAMNENAALRRSQAQHLVERHRRERGAQIVLGDFNETEDGDAVKTFERAGLTRACGVADAHCGATWPGADSHFPALFQIDHVLGRGVTFSGAHVIRAGGSDHYPLFARFNPSASPRSADAGP